MARPQTKPFAFPDLNAAAPVAPAAAPAAASVLAEIEAARAQGVIEGRKLAMETIAADEAAALARIADACASLTNQSRALGETKAEISAQCAVFLESFAINLAASREVKLAMNLIERLLLSPSNRKPATLHLSAKNFSRLSASLETRLIDTGLADIVTLTPDKALRAGECRLVWHDGQARCTSAEITAAVAKIFPKTPHSTEKHQ